MDRADIECCEVLKTALEGVGIGGGYHTADNFE